MVYGFMTGKQYEEREDDPGCERERVKKRKAVYFNFFDITPLTFYSL